MNHKSLILIVGLAVAMLVVAIPAIWPYGYYQLLRWVIASAAALVAYDADKKSKSAWVWIFMFLAILFNPIAPVALRKSMWIIVDLGSAGIFVMYMLKEKINKSIYSL